MLFFFGGAYEVCVQPTMKSHFHITSVVHVKFMKMSSWFSIYSSASQLVGREMFWDNLNIFWKKLLVYLVMSSETNFSWSGPKIKVSAKSGPRHQKGWEPLIYRAYFSTYGLVWFNIRNRLDAEKTYWSKYTDITELKKITVEFTWNPSILLCLFDLIQKNVQLLVPSVLLILFFFWRKKWRVNVFGGFYWFYQKRHCFGSGSIQDWLI